jgi:hypothetical protein
MSDMEGGCACGAVRFKIAGPLAGVGVCYCRACQYASGGGPAYVALAPKSGFAITKGEPKVFSSKSDAGADIGRAFCPDCGTPIYSIPSETTPFFPVKLGALDDSSGLAPMVHVYTEAAQPWHLMHEGLPKFARMPGGPPG